MSFKSQLCHLLLTIMVLTCAACASQDSATEKRETSKAAKGAGYGALAGAVIGAVTAGGDKGKSVLTGALAGAAIGGGIGYYMDKQEARLRQELKQTDVNVVREGNNIRLVMPGNITFDHNQDLVRQEFQPILSSIAEVLGEYDQTSIRIAGHTDATGSSGYNQGLSDRRANNVGRFLINRDVQPHRIRATGYGSRYPIASNTDESGRQANRRVEMELIPL